jgi:hypothetical protein
MNSLFRVGSSSESSGHSLAPRCSAVAATPSPPHDERHGITSPVIELSTTPAHNTLSAEGEASSRC